MRRVMFSMMMTASSITNPMAMVSAISEILSRLKSRKYITTSVAAMESGMVMLGMTVAQRRRRNKAMTRTTRTRATHHGELDVGNCGADQQGAVVDHVDLDRRRYPALELRQRRKNVVDRLDDIGVGLLDDVHHQRLARR